MRQFVTAAVIILVVAVAGGLLITGVAKVRGAADRARCQSNLKQLAVAVNNYASSFQDRLPLAAIANDNLRPEKRLSWTVNLMPYLESNMLYRNTDKTASWDDPANGFLLNIDYNPLYSCRSASSATDALGRHLTPYVAIAGIGGESPRRGVFSFDRTLRLTDIPDQGATLLFAETRASNGPWIAAGKPTLRVVDREGSRYFGFGGQFAGYHSSIGTIAVFVDGSVKGLDANIDPRVFEDMATVAKRGKKD